MTSFYLAAVAITLVLTGLALRPLLRRKLLGAGTAGLLVIAGVGFGVYELASNYDATAASVPGDDIATEMRALEARLAADPGDADGWALLARSYKVAENFPKAADAFAAALRETKSPDPDLLLDYAETLAAMDQDSIASEAGQLIENALNLQPGNLRALWYGATVAAARGDRELAAQRFEAMLRSDTPPEIREILNRNIASLRSPLDVSANEPVTQAASGDSIAVQVDVDPARQASWPPGAVFYLIATTKEGGPPLAVVRQPVATLPGLVEIGDKDAMIAGRTISSQQAIRLVARISMSGQPIASTGDVFGELQVDLPVNETLAITIDQQVN